MQQMTEEQQRALQERIKNMSPEELKEFQKQQCIFCQIIDGKIPSKKVYEDDKCLAVMDVNPASLGHVLLLPKEHFAIMPQIPDKIIGHLFMAAKAISQIMLKKLKVEGTNIFAANGPAAGQRAQHFMIHIIPRKDRDEVLDLPEHVVEMGQREKLAEVLGKKMGQLLGVKRETQERLAESAEEEEPKSVKKIIPVKESIEEPEQLITSPTAKRYHKSKCAFAQNIKEEKRVYLTPEEAEQSERQPCTCVTGKKIPLPKKEPGQVTKKKAKKIEKIKSEEKKVAKKKIAKKKKVIENEEASLDDIANLFK